MVSLVGRRICSPGSSATRSWHRTDPADDCGGHSTRSPADLSIHPKCRDSLLASRVVDSRADRVSKSSGGDCHVVCVSGLKHLWSQQSTRIRFGSGHCIVIITRVITTLRLSVRHPSQPPSTSAHEFVNPPISRYLHTTFVCGILGFLVSGCAPLEPGTIIYSPGDPSSIGGRRTEWLDQQIQIPPAKE